MALQFDRRQNSVMSPRCAVMWSTTVAARVIPIASHWTHNWFDVRYLARSRCHFPPYPRSAVVLPALQLSGFTGASVCSGFPSLGNVDLRVCSFMGTPSVFMPANGLHWRAPFAPPWIAGGALAGEPPVPVPGHAEMQKPADGYPIAGL